MSLDCEALVVSGFTDSIDLFEYCCNEKEAAEKLTNQHKNFSFVKIQIFFQQLL